MVKLADLNPYLTCCLCKGYMVNATAISECMHTFCKSCIVKEFVTNATCPQCGISVNPTEPTKTLKSDNLLQDLINKLVPGLATKEREARKQFYLSRGEPEEDTIETLESTFLTPKKRALYRQAGLPVYVMLQHERSSASSSLRAKRYPGHMIRFPSDLTILHLKEFIQQRLSLAVVQPTFEDVKSQKAWERSRMLAIENSPDVDILCGDYLLDDDITLGLLHRIKHGFVQRAMLPLMYRFRGTLKSAAQTEPSTQDTTFSLVSSAPVQATPTSGKNKVRSHVTCLSRGKEKTVTRSVRRSAGMINKGRASNSQNVPLAPHTTTIHKSPVMKKSIVIQRSSKPPSRPAQLQNANSSQAQPQYSNANEAEPQSSNSSQAHPQNVNLQYVNSNQIQSQRANASQMQPQSANSSQIRPQHTNSKQTQPQHANSRQSLYTNSRLAPSQYTQVKQIQPQYYATKQAQPKLTKKVVIRNPMKVIPATVGHRPTVVGKQPVVLQNVVRHLPIGRGRPKGSAAVVKIQRATPGRPRQNPIMNNKT